MLETRSHGLEHKHTHTHARTHVCMHAHSQSTQEGTGAGGEPGVRSSPGWIFITGMSWGYHLQTAMKTLKIGVGMSVLFSMYAGVRERNWDKQKLQTTWRPPCMYDILHSSALQQSPPIQWGLCYHNLERVRHAHTIRAMGDLKSHMIWLMFLFQQWWGCEFRTHGTTAIIWLFLPSVQIKFRTPQSSVYILLHWPAACHGVTYFDMWEHTHTHTCVARVLNPQAPFILDSIKMLQGCYSCRSVALLLNAYMLQNRASRQEGVGSKTDSNLHHFLLILDTRGTSLTVDQANQLLGVNSSPSLISINPLHAWQKLCTWHQN